MDRKLKILIIIFVFIIISGGFFYFISVNGFSFYHAGINVTYITEEKMNSKWGAIEVEYVTTQDLEKFPQIYTMINLLLEEKENKQGTRSFFVNFDTYRIFNSHDKLKIKNNMSDLDATKLSNEFRENFGWYILYEGNYFSIHKWIA